MAIFFDNLADLSEEMFISHMLCTLNVVHGSRNDRTFMYLERFYLGNVWIEFKQVQ